nr:putative ribonuclease h protein [Quercus suber]
MKFTTQVSFDQLIADIEKDIHCFDSTNPACKNPKELHMGRSHLGEKGPSTVNVTPNNTPTKSTTQSPLKDITNHTLAQSPLNPGNDKHWIRIQWPIAIAEDENMKVYIGKRGSLPTTENSNSQKRRAVTEDGSDTPLPQTAVAVLIDKERNCWIDDAIDNNFLPQEAKMIKSIPLCFTEARDQMYWPGKVDGVYSIKAGYRFLIEDELTPSTGPLAPLHTKSIWKGLWKLRIPNRTKTLLWRAASDALPSLVNLMKRKVLSDASCQVCGLEQETALHALWGCPKLEMVWDLHFGPLRNDAKDCLNFLEVVQVCMEKGHPTELMAMITSQIWLRRNKLRIDELKSSKEL